MASNLSVKNVPESILAELRARAARNYRSLQGELMSILEAAVSGQQPVADDAAGAQLSPAAGGGKLSVDTLAARARLLFPRGTPSSVDDLRAMRDSRHV